MTDEDIIKCRLLFDGDGTGDDRRINVLLKLFIKWCTSEYEFLPEIKTVQENMLLQLSQCKYMFYKTQLMSHMSKMELNSCSQLFEQIKQEIDDAKLLIETCKEEFQNAKIVRKNRSEYDVIAGVIQEQPGRKETNAKSSLLENELKLLEETRQEIDNKFEIRCKHFHVLVASLYQLQTMLFEEENEDSIDHSYIDISDEDMEIIKSECVEMNVD